MAQLTFMLRTKVLQSEKTVVGDTVYEGGDLLDHNKQQVGVFAAITDTINGVTNNLPPNHSHGGGHGGGHGQRLDTGTHSMTLFFFETKGGHGGGQGARAQAPESIVLEGANDFEDTPNKPQPRETMQAIGSVSAASTQWKAQIDQPFRRDRDTLVIG